jgi:hypothetical protein
VHLLRSDRCHRSLHHPLDKITAEELASLVNQNREQEGGSIPPCSAPDSAPIDPRRSRWLWVVVVALLMCGITLLLSSCRSEGCCVAAS